MLTPTTTGDETLQQKNAEIRKKTGEFVLALLQGFLRTGYYLPNHPEASKAKAGLHQRLQSLLEPSGEITFLAVDQHEKRSVVIEGVTRQPLRLVDIINRGAAETYLPRFIQFLKRKELISLSLKAQMAEQELSQFVDLMSEPAYDDMRGSTGKEQFVASLKGRRIHNISFVFAEDLISSRPDVPWRTRTALSRLKKDIHLLPILRDLTDEKLHQLKLQILTDILRPLGVADFVYSFLLNLDLVSSDLLSEEDAELAVFKLISDRLLIEAGNQFINDILAEAGFPEHVHKKKVGRLLAGFCQRLNAVKDVQAGFMLESLFNQGIIPLEALSETHRNRVLTLKRVGTFLLKPDTFIHSVEQTTTPDVYTIRLKTLVSFVPLLVEHGNFQEAISIVEMINRHVLEKSGRSACALQSKNELIFGDTLSTAAGIFLTATKEVRTLIGQLFVLCGNGSIPHLQHILIDSRDPWRSKQAAETLKTMGEHAAASLITGLDSTMLSSESVPAVLRSLSELPVEHRKSDVVRLLLKHAGDQHEETRREALSGLCRVCPESAYSHFTARLSDPDLRIRKIAVRGLGLAGDRRGFERLASLIEKAEDNHWPEDVEIAALAIDSLGTLMTRCPAAQKTIKAYFSTLVDRYCNKSTWRKILPGSFVAPEALVVSLTETIGKHDDPAILNMLAILAHHTARDVSNRAQELFNRVV